jgi:uncharacterized protein YhbP (UPF0306 family)
MKRTTIVKNVITEQEETYFNSYSLDENVVSSIITVEKQTSNLMNAKVREKYAKEVKMIPSIKGGKTAHAQNYDLIGFYRV